MIFNKSRGRAVLLALCILSVLSGCQPRSGNSGVSSGEISSDSSASSELPSSSDAPDSSLPVPSSPSSASEDSSSDSSDDVSDPVAVTGSVSFGEISALDKTPVQWGPGKQFDEENRPTACIGLQQQFDAYHCLFLGEPGQNGQKTVYLTFDQGYENGYTSQILDTLREKNVPAVFFLTGHYVETSSPLIDRMVEEGHVLGNHSNRHLDATEVPLEQARNDLDELRSMVREQFGEECALYRFPEGKFSEQTLALVRQEGCTPVFWSFAYADWDPANQPDPSEALSTLTSRLHNGAVYLLHSVSATNAAVLGDFIDAARAEGYEFRAIRPYSE